MGLRDQQLSKRDVSFSSLNDLELEAPSGTFYKEPRTTIPFRKLRTSEWTFVGIALPRTPTTRALWSLLGLAIVVLVLIQALSCGLFFCVALPVGRASYIDLREVFTEFRLFNQPQTVTPADPAPMLIPRIVHQTFRTRQLPAPLRPVVQTWTRVNGPGWQTRFYDDDACIDFVRREFPEYLDAYFALPKDVERSDFFRYMVILRFGGVYADIDVELRQPLDTVIGPTDTLVVGWEAEVATDAEAFKRHFVRRRQVLQWFFAAAPGHPVLRAACEHIARNVRRTFSNNTNRDTLERTGPGMWTDAVLRHAAAHPPTLANDPWKVRILPRVAFGVHPAGIDGLTTDAKEIVVMHHFLGSWKKRGGWHKRRTVLQILAGAVSAALQRRGEVGVVEEPIRPSVLPLFPVSAAFNPPFTVMTHLIGHGDMQSGSDVSAMLTSWGTWQPAMSRPSRKPLVVEALVGSLGPPEQGAVLVDVSAGPGFFSLAAAARGHDVVAFESSPRSIEAFSAAVVYNGFQDRVRLYNVSLGAAASTLCLRPRPRELAMATGLVAAVSGGAVAEEPSLGAAPEVNDAEAAAARRGYGDPALHSLPQAECASMTVRQTLAHMLMGGAEAADSGGGGGGSAATAAAVGGAAALTTTAGGSSGSSAVAASAAGGGNATGAGTPREAALPFRVGALRLSAHGWEGWVLDGAAPWLERHRPGVVLLEYAPALVARSGYPGGGVRLLERLWGLGYVHVAHAGYVCDERWFNISRALRAGGTALGELAAARGPDRGGGGSGVGDGGGGGGAAGRDGSGDGAGALPRQPTWCKLKPDLFQLLTDRAHPEVAENVLFIHHTHNSVRGETAPSPQVLADGQPHGADTGRHDAPLASTGSESAGAVTATSGQRAALETVEGTRLRGPASGQRRAVVAGTVITSAATGSDRDATQGLGRRGVSAALRGG